MTCENCIHFDICNENADGNIVELMKVPCFRFMELVRCKECTHYKPQKKSAAWNSTALMCNRVVTLKMLPDDFCSRGERKIE